MNERSPGDEFSSRGKKRKRLWGAKQQQFQQARTWVNVSIVGIQFPVAIAIGFFFGRWLDRMFGTWPWLTGIFALFGIAAGFINLFRITAAAERDEQALARAREAAEAAETAAGEDEDSG